MANRWSILCFPRTIVKLIGWCHGPENGKCAGESNNKNKCDEESDAGFERRDADLYGAAAKGSRCEASSAPDVAVEGVSVDGPQTGSKRNEKCCRLGSSGEDSCKEGRKR